jgi:hypothetical protein
VRRWIRTCYMMFVRRRLFQLFVLSVSVVAALLVLYLLVGLLAAVVLRGWFFRLVSLV